MQYNETTGLRESERKWSHASKGSIGPRAFLGTSKLKGQLDACVLGLENKVKWWLARKRIEACVVKGAPWSTVWITTKC